MADKELVLDLLARDKGTPVIRRFGESLDDLGDSTDDLGRDFRKLDSEITQAEANLRDLAQEFARTDDAAKRMDLSKAMRKQQTEIRRLTRARDILPGPAEMAAEGAKLGAAAGTQIATTLRGSLRAAAPAMVAVLGGVAVAAAPVLGGAIAGAVIGGASIGGVVGGVALASRDPRVAAAGKTLGQTLLKDLEDRSGVFVGPVLESIETIRRGFGDMGGDLDRIFKNSSRFLGPLTQGVIAFTQRITSGLADLSDVGGPVIDVISTRVAQLGDAVGDVFTSLADNGVDAAVALNQVFDLLEGTIRGVGGAINFLTETYGFLAKIGAFGREAQLEYVRLEQNAKLAAAANDELGGSFQRGAVDVAAMTERLQAADDATRGLVDANRSLYASTTSVGAAVDAARESLEKNGRSLSSNTEKGRANRTALQNLAVSLGANYDAYVKVNGAGYAADEVAARNRASFVKLATTFTGSASKANALADQMLGIPNIKRSVTISGVEAARAAARTISATLRAIKDENVNINYQVNGTNSSALRAAANKNRESGGPVKKNTAYIVGEKRPEVFVPDRDGKIIPSIEQYNQASGRFDKAAATSGVATATPVVVNVHVQVAPTANLAEVGRVTAEALDAYFRMGGRRP